MKIRQAVSVAVSVAAMLAWTTPAHAHCDTLDGPVVSSARSALETGNVNLVLVWVQPQDEAQIRDAFKRARTVRTAGADAKQLADTYFFETVVRVHRAGEGAPYTGLKPAGTVEPPVAAADQAIASGKLQPLAKLISDRNEQGLHRQYEQLMNKKGYAANDVDAGRAYTGAYVQFVHYAERLYDAAELPHADGGHAPENAHAH